MKTFTLKSCYACLVLLTLFFTMEVNAQTGFNFTVNPQTQCYIPFNTSASASVTASFSNITGYTWSGAGSCSIFPSTYSGTSTSFTLPCCGIFSITCTAYSGTAIVTSLTKTVSVICSSVSIVNSQSLTVCAGSPINISAAGANSYTWNTGSNFSTISVSPTVTTCYTVSGTNSNGCNGSAVACVTVIPGVNITGNTNICAGSSTTLFATGSNNFTWSPGNSTGTSIVVSPTVNTCYYAQGAYTAGCNSGDSICINVQLTPTLSVVGNSIVCSGYVSMSATGATSYTWMPGNLTGNSVNVLVNSNTCFTVTGSTPGCNPGSAVKCLTVLPSPTLVISGNTNICPGGSATLTVSGANTYTWNNPINQFSPTIIFTPTATTCFSVLGQNSNGCTGGSGTCVTVQSGSLSVTGNSIVCAGTSATLTASGALAYTWSPGGMNGSSIVVSPTVNTCYTVTGSSGTCTSTGVKCLTVQTNPVVSAISSSSTICSGSGIFLSASGANTYTWLPFNVTGSSVSITPTVSTCYTVIGKTTAGCTGTATGCFTVLPSPTISITGNALICIGSSATLTASGATSYTWQPTIVSPSHVVTPTITTCYNVIGSASGCTASAVRCVTVQSSNIAITGNSVTCAGKSVTLTANGSVSYTWMPGNMTTTVIVVTPTASTCYSVVGINSNSCNTSGTKCITVYSLPVINTMASGGSMCAGSPATLTASGAISYTWTPFNQNGASIVITPTASMCYTVSGMNNQGCIGSVANCFSVTPLPSLSVSGTATLCAGASTTLTANGANSYTWMPGNLSGSSVVVSPMTTTCYTLTGASSGCFNSTVKCVTVTPTSITVIGSSVICQGNSAVLTASGTSSYTWLPGSLTGNSIVVSPTATTCYTVLGTTANGCNTSGIKCISVQSNPVITLANNNVFCSGVNATLTASGASNYTWTPFNQTGANIVITPTASMCYTVYGTIAPGCSGSATNCFSVTPNPTITVSGIDSICSGVSTTLSASGANSYTWIPSNITGANIVVSPTTSTCYTVSGTSAAGCTSSKVKCITVQPSVIAVTGASVICTGNSATLSVSGSSTYTWLPGNMTGNSIVVSPTASTCYTVLGTSSAGCNSSGIKCITVQSNPVISISSPSFLCSGNTATLTASGASTYTWLPFNQTGSSIVLTPTTSMCYTVMGKSTAGCSGTAVNCFSLMPPPVISIGGNAVLCSGETTTLTAGGATSYTWLPGGTNGANVAVTPSSNTCYTVIGSNNNGCLNAAVKCITVTTQPPLSITGNTNICIGKSTLLVVSGTNTYTWNTGSNSPTINVTPTVATCYIVSGTGNTGCVRSGSICVNVFANPVVAISGNTSVCSGGTALLLASGANSYTWSTGAVSPTISVAPNVTTTYTVNGKTNFGCTGTATTTVNVNGFPYLFVAPYDSVICQGESLQLYASGAQTYSWSNGANTPNITVIPSGSTTYYVTGYSGVCHTSISVPVQVNSCIGVTENKHSISGLSLFPNPANELITMKHNGTHKIIYKIYDINGRKIIAGDFVGNTTLNISEFVNGIYFISFEDGSQSLVRKLIVDK